MPNIGCFCRLIVISPAVSRGWLIPLAPGDQHPVGGGLEGEAQAEQAVEGGGGRAPAVEPEHELVEPRVRLAGPGPGSGLEVLLAQAVVEPQCPFQLPTNPAATVE